MHMEAQYSLILFLNLEFYLCCHLDKLSQLWVKNGTNINLLEGWERLRTVCSVGPWLGSCLQVYRYWKGNKNKAGLGKPLSVYRDTGKSSLTAQASHRGHLDLAHFSELNKIIVQLKAKLWGKFILSFCWVKKYWKCKKFQLISRIHLLFIHLFFQTASKY